MNITCNYIPLFLLNVLTFGNIFFGRKHRIRLALTDKIGNVEYGFNVDGYLFQGDNKGVTPLMQAALSGQNHCISALLQLGARDDLKDNNGRTALMISVEKKLVDTADLLLSSTDDNNDNVDIFRSICRNGLQSMASKFLEMICNLNQQEKMGILAAGLEAAAEFGEEKIAKMILNQIEKDD